MAKKHHEGMKEHHKGAKMGHGKHHGDGFGHANVKGGLIHTPMSKQMEGKGGKGMHK